MATEERRWRRGLGRDREEEGLCNTRLVRLRFDDDADGADERARAPSSDRSSSGRGASRTARRGRAGKAARLVVGRRKSSWGDVRLGAEGATVLPRSSAEAAAPT